MNMEQLNMQPLNAISFGFQAEENQVSPLIKKNSEKTS